MTQTLLDAARALRPTDMPSLGQAAPFPGLSGERVRVELPIGNGRVMLKSGGCSTRRDHEDVDLYARTTGVDELLQKSKPSVPLQQESMTLSATCENPSSATTTVFGSLAANQNRPCPAAATALPDDSSRTRFTH